MATPCGRLRTPHGDELGLPFEVQGHEAANSRTGRVEQRLTQLA